MAVRPFQFTGLPRFTKEQAALQESMAAHLSHKIFRPSFKHALADALGTLVRLPCDFAAGEQRAIGRPELAAIVHPETCLFLIGVGAGESGILVELDTEMALFVVERLLGGTGDGGHVKRALTEIEEGVLSFLILKAIGQFHDAWETGREMGLTLDRFGASVDAFEGRLDRETTFQMVGFRLAAGRRQGYVRLFIPQSLIHRRFGAPPPQSGATAREHAQMGRVLRSLGPQTTTARMEISRLSLATEDLANLEPGDIIVLEDHRLSLSAKGIAGEVFVRIGAGNNGGFRGQVLPGSDHARLRVIEIVAQETPLETPMSGEGSFGHIDEEASQPDEALRQPQTRDFGVDNGATRVNRPQPKPAGDESADADLFEGHLPEEDNLEQTEGLLRDVEAPVVIELGRLRLNTSQIVRLRGGQILRLNRGPNDPVDLVVNGKLFARAELVEVEGELGVRLLQVVGAG